MAGPIRQRGTLLALAAEGFAASVPGCAQAFHGGQRAGDRFKSGIIARWREWFPTQHRARQMAALEQLAGLPASVTRDEATAAVERMTPTASPEDRIQAIAYLCLLPRTVQRRLVPDPHTGGLTLPSFQSVDDEQVLRDLLACDVPPVPPNAPLAGTPYTLGDVVRSDPVGVTYRATTAETRVAVQFVRESQRLDPPHLDKLVALGGEQWPDQLVRLIRYNRDGLTPFLILDTVPTADLTTLLVHLRHQTGRGPSAEEVLGLMKQLAGALASLHALGLVHGAIAPTSVLIVGDAIKLADLALSPSGDAIDDVHTFGLLWYRLLLADWSATPGADWKDQLTRLHDLRPPHLDLLDRCLGDPAHRPANGQAVVAALEARPPEEHRQAFAEVSPEEIRAVRLRREKLLVDMKHLREDWLSWEEEDARTRPFSRKVFLLASMAGLLLGVVGVTASGFTFPRLAFVLPLAFFLGLAIERWLHWKRRAHVRTRYAEIIAQTEQLADEYRDEVDSWGGSQVLRNVEVVREFIQALQLDGGPAL